MRVKIAEFCKVKLCRVPKEHRQKNNLQNMCDLLKKNPEKNLDGRRERL